MNFQDVYAAWEVAAGKAFSVTTEIPIRLVAPDINPNTAGLGDVSVTTKTVLLTGNNWQITQLFRTYMPTDTPLHGTGNGHVSLEPGMLFRYKWTDETYFHAEAEYWIPLGDNPVYGGEILFYGFGISHLLYENDTYACIPTLEFVASTVFNGAQTQFPTGAVQPVDTMTIVNVHPGLRSGSGHGRRPGAGRIRRCGRLPHYAQPLVRRLSNAGTEVRVPMTRPDAPRSQALPNRESGSAKNRFSALFRPALQAVGHFAA